MLLFLQAREPSPRTERSGACSVVQVPDRVVWEAQLGRKAPYAKPLKGFGGAGILEVVDDFDGDTYRAVYTVRFAGVVYVLHAFQKKSKRGMATPRQEMALINQRLQRAREDYEQWQSEQRAKRR